MDLVQRRWRNKKIRVKVDKLGSILGNKIKFFYFWIWP